MKDVLQEARRATLARRKAYGQPLDNLTRTAALWAGILGHSITAEEVALCMAAVKLARECHRHQKDNLVDLAGYAACVQAVHDERNRRQSGRKAGKK